MPYDKDTLPPPSYTESASHSQPPSHLQPHTHRGQALLDQLTLTRTTHIQSTITTHIIPLLSQRAALGLARTTLALLPSDIPLPPLEEKSEFSFGNAFGTTRPVEVIGYASDEELKTVRLEGEMDATEFWRVQAVVEELERVLREMLNRDVRVGRSEFEEVLPKRKIWERFMPGLGGEGKGSAGSEVGVRHGENAGQVLVKVRLEEVCLRTVNEFGLYDTMARQCIIVRVDARC
ncbi:hypothetical protein HBI71_068860 [Parastagonospora nodorum]|nr:hypothetical protein HBI71_068860 [Parastagonospora nodorum]